MPLFFFGKNKKVEEVDPRITERTRELLEAYKRLTDSVLIDTIRITEGLLDRTGMSDIDRTLWGAEFPKEDVEGLAKDEENLKAVQEKVMNTIQSTTGFEQAEVNVHVSGIAFET